MIMTWRYDGSLICCSLGSPAAKSQSRIGYVSKKSWFAFMQSYGANGPARKVMMRGGMYFTLSMAAAVAGKGFCDLGMGKEGEK